MILALGAIGVAGVCHAQSSAGGKMHGKIEIKHKLTDRMRLKTPRRRKACQRTNANANGQVSTEGRVRVDQNVQRSNADARAMRRDDRDSGVRPCGQTICADQILGCGLTAVTATDS